MTEKKPVAVIVGPTGVGKTAASVLLAKKINAEIISCDSMQVYRGMNIGTAKITKAEMQGVPHHLIDIRDPWESYSVCEFVTDCKEKFQEITIRGKLPILIGGTGLYADSFIRDIDFSKGDSDESIRKELTRILNEKGTLFLHRLLEKVDAESAAAIHPNNAKRVIRALEYYRVTGEKISDHNRQSQDRSSPYNACYIGFTRDRDELYERIENRVDKMFSDGLSEEVFSLIQNGCKKNMTAMQALGYKEIFNYYSGKCTLSETVRILKRDSRHYAKRQFTWFKRNNAIHWINLSRCDNPETITKQCINLLKANGVIS